jgi:hypothetical protein
MSWALLADEDTGGVQVTGTVMTMGSGEEASEVNLALKEVGTSTHFSSSSFSFYPFIIIISNCRSHSSWLVFPFALLKILTHILPHQISHMLKASITCAQIMGSSIPSRSYSHIRIIETLPFILAPLLNVFPDASWTFPVEDERKRKRQSPSREFGRWGSQTRNAR